MVTLGADDVDFVAIVTYCANPLGSAQEADENSIADSARPLADARELLLPTIERLEQEPRDGLDGLAWHCTKDNPGETIEKLFWQRLSTVQENFASLVNDIRERGERDQNTPHIVWTTYYDPLPQPSESDWCLDVADLTRDQLDYLSFLLATMNQLITHTVGDLGATVVDISDVLSGHEWCTADPWAYGLSVLLLNLESKAPFHPTPAGQQAIAQRVLAAASTAFQGNGKGR